DPATREFDSSTGRRMTGEWTLMLGFKTEFNVYHPRSENHFLHEVAVSRERSGKWPGELIADSFLPFHEQARHLQHYIFRIVRHNPIEVGSAPRLVVLMDERFDVKPGLGPFSSDKSSSALLHVGALHALGRI